jgi:hypothetical protein
LTQGRSTHLAASHTAPVAGEAVALPLAGGSQECPGALIHGGRPSSCCRLLPLLGQTRGRTVDADAGWPSDTTTSCASTLKSDIIEAWKRRKKKNHRKEAWKRRKKRRQRKLDRLKPVPHRLKPD